MYWLLVILILIPQVASAECAWVLWWQESGSPTSNTKKDVSEVAKSMQTSEWRPHAIITTMQDCVQYMYKSHKNIKKDVDK
jgi:hypothetical protein